MPVNTHHRHDEIFDDEVDNPGLTAMDSARLYLFGPDQNGHPITTQIVNGPQTAFVMFPLQYRLRLGFVSHPRGEDLGELADRTLEWVAVRNAKGDGLAVLPLRVTKAEPLRHIA